MRTNNIVREIYIRNSGKNSSGRARYFNFSISWFFYKRELRHFSGASFIIRCRLFMLNRYQRFFSFCLSESHFSSLNSFAEEYRLQYSSVNPYIVEEPLRLVLLEPARRHINSMSILSKQSFSKFFFSNEQISLPLTSLSWPCIQFLGKENNGTNIRKRLCFTKT